MKPFIKAKGFTDAQRIALYKVSEKDFDFTDTLEKADVVLLTMAWNYYLKTKQTGSAISCIEACTNANKKVIVHNVGDFGVRIPYFKNLIVLRSSGYRSKFTKNEFALPIFIADPLQKYYTTNQVFQRPYTLKPVIGFCGQANSSLFNAIKEKSRTVLRNFKSYLGLSKAEPQHVLSTSFLRALILKTLQQSQVVSTNFILRKKYRAGVTTDKDAHKSTMEFYGNLKNSDYVVCVRGAGNFSVRFYETLAMGRIPVFINTDCALPLDEVIPWKKHVVWVDYKERHIVAKKVNEFHKALSEADFIALQQTNRDLWKDYLTMGGFFKEVFRNLN